MFLLNISYAQVIMNFIWEQSIHIIVTNLGFMIFLKVKDVVKRILSKNNYINKYIVKYKKGSVKHEAKLDIHHENKNLITDKYDKLLNYIHTNDKLKVKKIINKHNSLISSYNLIADCELKINKEVYVAITNSYEKNSGTIISTIELFSYTQNNEFLELFINEL